MLRGLLNKKMKVPPNEIAGLNRILRLGLPFGFSVLWFLRR